MGLRVRQSGESTATHGNEVTIPVTFGRDSHFRRSPDKVWLVYSSSVGKPVFIAEGVEVGWLLGNPALPMLSGF